ncbi:hypothetical protein NL676_026560 [Syzygium grande]|nr:hypothetical protein NL676_026560 [Syzygium grande]
MKALKDAEDMKVLDSLNYSDARCRMNTIKEIEAVTNSFDKSYKIGEGGGQSSSVALIIYLFQLKFSCQMQLKEDQVSARSACPGHGCQVHKFMANGSLDDLLRRGKSLFFLGNFDSELLQR